MNENFLVIKLEFSYNPNKKKFSSANSDEDDSMSEMTSQVSWKKITPGGVITKAGNAEEFNTGDWRSTRPVFIKEKCKQCMLCCPVCPDSSIPVSDDGKREDFDYKHCKGCGICAKACPFGAIEME